VLDSDLNCKANSREAVQWRSLTIGRWNSSPDAMLRIAKNCKVPSSFTTAYQRMEENFVLLAAYRSSNLGQSASIKLVRSRQGQVHGIIARNWREYGFSRGFCVLCGPTRAAQVA
jgi:hypothetical protein